MRLLTRGPLDERETDFEEKKTTFELQELGMNS